MSYPEEEFEREMTRSLRRVDAPAELMQKVMDGTSGGSRGGRLLEFPRQKVWIGSLAASLIVGALLVRGVEHHHRLDERARAARDFARSTEITDRVMEQTRKRIQQAGVALDE